MYRTTRRHIPEDHSPTVNVVQHIWVNSDTIILEPIIVKSDHGPKMSVVLIRLTWQIPREDLITRTNC
jgi:hypothetical protein